MLQTRNGKRTGPAALQVRRGLGGKGMVGAGGGQADGWWGTAL
jgi:hypothetical protein